MNAISSTLTPFKNAGNVNQCSVTQVIIVSLTGRAAVVQFFFACCIQHFDISSLYYANSDQLDQ